MSERDSTEQSEPAPVGYQNQPEIDYVDLGVPKDFPWGSSRRGTKVDTIVIHFTDGHSDDPSRVAGVWIKPPHDAPADQKWGREASAHWINPRQGQLARFMPEEWAAWHTPGVNSHSIGIENCAFEGELLTASQEQRLVGLINDIRKRFPITRITGHRFASSKGVRSTDCPGWLFGVGPENPDAQRAALRKWVARYWPDLANAV